MVSDSFYAKPVEGYPVENSLALTSAFIYAKGSGKKMKMGTFEMDVIWIYIFAALILIGAIIGGILCCCSGDASKEETPEGEKKEEEDMMMMDEEKMDGDMMMEGEGDMAMGE
mmetsp:Transcript_21400/g.33101  ORF Transcript_21400/g.33101 Transcript_21400/m.33101 type:complete len:113 (-) Transcript_21400:51-389(-)|eukprot:CAMPEP_0170480852 /NCGR_PEP_ID=MMETSP0208-20121228/1525_1 /TAXON_ID=197538 /ORGANISM="Strombidium inclinatum, Strain S3" /LENGTH=112 /DNA_ID=CAMNT_0010753455 /DNA_START=119 /DNA_END=457 /DNA_ORIENTATION=-